MIVRLEPRFIPASGTVCKTLNFTKTGKEEARFYLTLQQGGYVEAGSCARNERGCTKPRSGTVNNQTMIPVTIVTSLAPTWQDLGGINPILPAIC